MPNKPAYTISEQLTLLKSRGMLFHNENNAKILLANISYYRLKGYWWDMQSDFTSHTFSPNSYFEDVIERYNFDRHLRLILFDAIERIEIALRSKMIYHLSISYGSLWYLNTSLFENDSKTIGAKTQSTHLHTIDELKKDFNRSQEIFIKDQKRKHPNDDADVWKLLEVASMGTLSKLYKALLNQLPEKSKISKEMGLNLHNELSSWLEAITYVRNIIAHHSRLWSRNMVKKPKEAINNPISDWFNTPLNPVQSKKPFLIISSMIYLCNHVTPGHQIKTKIIDLLNQNQNIPIYKLGFLNNWKNQPLWK
jgi:abortive infection bacteriophage resistance protein